VGEGLLGRVIGADGSPLDGLGPLDAGEHASLKREPINPMARKPIDAPLDVGVRAINALLTVGRGQRLGLFAGSGVGKSTLLGMMTRYTNADVVVVGLIGERGREVKEFVEQTLGEEGRRRAVIVAAPADAPPLKRLRGAQYATAIAEWFRDRGQRVLLLMDSLTRYAQAQREIALAIGEPPATKGYPPSVFAMMPALVERAGNDADGRGSITAFYTVLTEGDDYRHDPIADAARAILDGHIVLSRDLAEAGHYPAIDIEASISRVMPAVVTREQLRCAQRFRQVYSAYRQQRDLIAVGAYQKGSDPQVDQAIEMWPQLRGFLQQEVDEPITLEQAIGNLAELAEQVNG
jgi:flagellum-specific ATP synthase